MEMVVIVKISSFYTTENTRIKRVSYRTWPTKLLIHVRFSDDTYKAVCL